MRALLIRFIAACAIVTLGIAPAGAQVARPETPAPVARPQGPSRPTPPDNRPDLETPDTEMDMPQWRTSREVFRIGQDFTLQASETVREVVVISNNATIHGRVQGDLVVILGSAELGPTAVVEGSLVVISGVVQIQSGAVVQQEFVAIASSVDTPANFVPGQEQVIIDPLRLGGRLRAVVPWVTQGLLWGRLIVASQTWIWVFVTVIFFAYLAFLLLFTPAVRASSDVLASRPLSTFFVGLLVLLLSGPLLLILAASVVGIIVIPFLLCALVIAGLVGRIGVMRWIGSRLVHESEPDDRMQVVRSFVLGFVLVSLIYMVPVLGLTTFLLIGVLGLGSATSTLAAALRRENPTPPKPPTPAPVLPPAPIVPTYVPAATFPDGVAEPVPGPSATTSSTVGGTDLRGFPHASFMERAAAFLLDTLLVVLVTAFLDLGDRAWILLMLGYHIVFWTTKATTVGGIICNLRVVKIDGTPLTGADALVRALSSIFSLAVLGIGCFWILRDPERQAWHDIIAGTYVIKVPGKYGAR